MQGRVTPETVTKLETGQIFVFGSNLRGIHGDGAALTARKLFGARSTVGEGMTGRCYAIPTKHTPWERRSLAEIDESVRIFLKSARFAQAALKWTFLVTAIGCGRAGYTPAQIAPLFEPVIEMQNVWLPASFWRVLSQRNGTHDVRRK